MARLAQRLILFSSIGSLSAPLAAGQSDYAAANRFQRDFAAACGAPAVQAVILSEWGAVGMLQQNQVGPIVRRLGLAPFRESEALATFEQSLAQPAAQRLLLKPARPGGFEPASLVEPSRKPAGYPVADSFARLCAAVEASARSAAEPLAAELPRYQAQEAGLTGLRCSTSPPPAQRGLFTREHETHAPDQLATPFHLLPRYQKLFRRLLTRLVAAGWLAPTDAGSYQNTRPFQAEVVRRNARTIAGPPSRSAPHAGAVDA